MRRHCLQAFLFAVLATPGLAAERFPAPEFTQGYQFPGALTPHPRAEVFSYVDVAVLITALGLAAYVVLKRRSRRETALVVVFSLLYFGFFRRGCICAIGAIQNVALAACSSDYALPMAAGAFFLVPLLFALLAGRVFCAAVCPLGAAQELVLLRPVTVPVWLDNALGTLPYLYLGAAVLFASTGSAFVICQYDPFVLFFRLGGGTGMLLFGVAILLTATVVGRPYCRYLCPYGVLLSLVSPFAKWRVSISPVGCRNCHQCAGSCPYGAIRAPSEAPDAERPTAGTGRLAVQWALLPILVLLGAWLVGLNSPVLAQVHPQVRLAQRVWLEEQGRVEGKTEATEAFEALGLPSVDLYREAAGIRSRFDTGSWVLGAWVGLVFGLRMITLSVRRDRAGYEPDPAACMACCRCYASCPDGRPGRSARPGANGEERR